MIKKYEKILKFDRVIAKNVKKINLYKTQSDRIEFEEFFKN